MKKIVLPLVSILFIYILKADCNYFYPIHLVSANSYIDYYLSDIKDFYNVKNSYLFDGDLKTAYGFTDSTVLYMKIPDKIPMKNLRINLVYKDKNSIPDELDITLIAAYNVNEMNSETADYYVLCKNICSKKYKNSELLLQTVYPVWNDSLRKNFKADAIVKEYMRQFAKEAEKFTYKLKFIVKITAKNKPQISEIYFNDRFITETPKDYIKFKELIIKNDNSLFGKSENGKMIKILQDSTMIFTLVDWIPKTDWAILHYVKNDEAGLGSRVSEDYLIIDLKNKKIVNKMLIKTSGVNLYSPLLEMDENGDLLLDVSGNYKIQLR